jgi:uncharacterized protein YbgA (DUF1722 family)/uncharacterized protein YbbK (DUF523 family)
MSDERTTTQQEPTIRLGISKCLLGENVRYDGGHKRDPFLIDELGQYVQWVPVCPEVEMGLPVPREAMRQVGDPEHPRLVTIKTGLDHTERQLSWAKRRLEELAGEGLHGFVFKKDSPSSGLYRVKVYNSKGVPQRTGMGLFARAFTQRFPLLPVEEEGRLHDWRLRENFIDCVFAYRRWTDMLEQNPTPGGLVQFHTAHKMTLLAHSPRHYRETGRLVAQAGSLPWDEIAEQYAALLMESLGELATPGRHYNVLQHLMSFLKDELGGEDKAELLGLMDDYRHGQVPLIVPITLLKHHLRRPAVPEWVHQQVYLYPYPKELMLRNHV